MARQSTTRSTDKQAKLGIKADATALYTRVSTDKQVDEGYSLDAQRERLFAYCTAQGWAVDERHLYTDAGISGKSTDRPAYQRMLADIEAGEVRRVVVTKLDRLSRNTKDFLGLLDYCDSRGCAVVSIAESFDTGTAVGRAVVTVLMSFAELERTQISQRVMSGKAQKATTGGYNGSRIPFGYQFINGRFEPTENAATVRGIFADYCNGEALIGIAQRLNADQVPTTRGGKWHAGTVRYILRNGAYAGIGQWDGVEVDGGAHPAIIEPELYHAAMVRMGLDKRDILRT